MSEDEISPMEKVIQLREELSQHHKTKDFLKDKSMGDLVRRNIHLLVQKEFIHSNV
jgi:hypothetical protein